MPKKQAEKEPKAAQVKAPIPGAILVDGANMAIRLDNHKGRDRVDFQAFERVLADHIFRREGRHVIWNQKLMYRTFHPGNPTGIYAGFNNYMHSIGWIVDERPAKQMPNGRWLDKGSDLALALDGQALVLNGYVSLLVVVTNDSDFAALFERLPVTTKKYSVCWRKRMPAELANAANPIYLEDIWNEIKMIPFVAGESSDAE